MKKKNKNKKKNSDCQNTESNEDDSVDSECKGNGAKHSWYNLIYYIGICLEGLRKTTFTSVDD
jgi:hypothetical protein